LTGVTLTPGPEFGAKRLQLLQELAPSITRTTFLATRDVLEQHRSAMRPVVVPVLVDAAEQYDEAFATILRERADAPMAARPQRVLVIGGGFTGSEIASACGLLSSAATFSTASTLSGRNTNERDHRVGLGRSPPATRQGHGQEKFPCHLKDFSK
jgi:hypothetical protein